MGMAQQQDKFAPRKPPSWNHVAVRGCGYQQPLILESEWWAVRHWLCAASNNYYRNGFGFNGRRNTFIVVCSSACAWLGGSGWRMALFRDLQTGIRLIYAQPLQRQAPCCWLSSLQFFMIEKPVKKEIQPGTAPSGDC